MIYYEKKSQTHRMVSGTPCPGEFSPPPLPPPPPPPPSLHPPPQTSRPISQPPGLYPSLEAKISVLRLKSLEAGIWALGWIWALRLGFGSQVRPCGFGREKAEARF